MLIIAQVLKEKCLKITGFAHSQTTNKLVKEAANDYARVSEQDRKKPPALGTNQIAGYGGFRPLTSLKKKIKTRCIMGYYSIVVWVKTQKQKFGENMHWLEKIPEGENVQKNQQRDNVL